MNFQIDDTSLFRQQALQWAGKCEVCLVLDSNSFQEPYSSFDVMVFAGAAEELYAAAGTAFTALEEFRQVHPGWMAGFMTYELKKDSENLDSYNPDRLGFPDLYFFIPQHLILVKGQLAEVYSTDPDGVMREIRAIPPFSPTKACGAIISARFNKQEYIDTVNRIRENIRRGDIYVTNFCQEFFAEETDLEPLSAFHRLNSISPNPFSAYLRLKDLHMLCASPERFLAKRDHKLISQPIKGTSKRFNDPAVDQQSRERLRNSRKEQQENVMIVDLVRNDLTRVAIPGSVRAEEVFGIYSFPQVHQMISTVVCELKPEVPEVEAIRNCFPMGSMTGAPKVRAMQLMEMYERTRRGLYSGCAGWFGPNGDFDFNVVIRTLLYNARDRYLSFQTGSAITFQSDAEEEYGECELKAKAILETLGMPQTLFTN